MRGMIFEWILLCCIYYAALNTRCKLWIGICTYVHRNKSLTPASPMQHSGDQTRKSDLRVVQMKSYHVSMQLLIYLIYNKVVCKYEAPETCIKKCFSSHLYVCMCCFIPFYHDLNRKENRRKNVSVVNKKKAIPHKCIPKIPEPSPHHPYPIPVETKIKLKTKGKSSFIQGEKRASNQ